MNSRRKKLNQINNCLDEQILDENQKVFTDMICYLRGSRISEYDVEVVRRDLTEMVLSAQKRGENIGSVIGGEDYKGFCDEVIASLPPKTVKQRFVDVLDIICCCVSILLVINIVFSSDTILIIQNLINRKPVDFNISFSFGNAASIVVIIAIACITVNVIMKNAFCDLLLSKKVVFGVVVVLIILFAAIAWLGKTTLFSVNIFIICILAAVLFTMHKVLEAF